MTRWMLIVGCCLVIAAPLQAADDAATAPFTSAQLEHFEKHVRPVLVERCQKCHGADEQEGGLRLDSRAALVKGGDSGTAIVPGRLDAGELLAAISYDPAGYQMPPDGKLPDAAIEHLRKWIAEGAAWPDEAVADAGDDADWDEEFARRRERWSFQPLRRPPIPAVSQPDWCRNPIDRFVLARIDAAGLVPVAESDRPTWLRRVHLDTVGLPPTLADLEAFLNDKAPGAHERVIDELLASPHFGERWGRHWLDLVRYAESRGHEFDYDVANPWPYRDYVIRAINEDVPYDQFVVEHVAGDLLKRPQATDAGSSGYSVRADARTGRNESILGTGFWFFGEWVHSPVDIRKEEADRFDNMIDVYSKTFLGLTVACARCHDHKFDPIPQSDFYAIQGYLQSSSYRQVRYESILHNQAIAEELESLDRQATERLGPLLEELTRDVRGQLPAYLLAARDAIAAGAELEHDPSQLVVFDFETGSYEGWERTGDAFGEIPQTQSTIADYQGNVGAQGTFFVNSHQRRDGGKGDDHVGTLTSPEFPIERPQMTLLVGGGGHAGETCVNLVVKGETVRTATGPNNNLMRPVTWDVADLKGATARIVIVDNHRGGWGNIGVDHITQHDATAPQETLPALSQAARDVVARLAEKNGLDATLLTHWTAACLAARDDDSNPLQSWSRAATDPALTTAALQSDIARRASANPDDLLALPALPTENFWTGADLIADGPGFQPWFDGLRLSSDPEQPVAGTLSRHVAAWNPDWPTLDHRGSVNDPGQLSSWPRTGRSLKSPTFEITGDKVYCLVQGGVNTYVAVDSHTIIAGPLHGSIVRKHNQQADWHWVEHDVARYRGHRAHVEISGGDISAPFAVAVVTLTPPSELVKNQPANEPIDNWESLATLLARRLTGDLPRRNEGSREANRFAGASLPFALRYPGLLGLDGVTARDRLREAMTPLVSRRNELYAAIQSASHTAPAMLEGSPEDEYVFIRGNWKKQGNIAPRQFLSVFSDRPAPAATEVAVVQPPTGTGRLELAEAMVDPHRTPIVARVIVNRIWLHYFGRGIVPTPDDFGYLGGDPSHPELLDWLASELVDHNWSQKHIHRLILGSSVYRLASESGAVKSGDEAMQARRNEVDPSNTLLTLMNIKRMEGEIIRDSLLRLSGRFDDTLYGPSVPIHLTSFLEGRGRPGSSGPVDGAGRRSLYIAVRRNFAEPFFQAFDLPTPYSTIGRRSVSNVPAQALALMNNPMVIEQTDRWARRLLEETAGQSIEERVRVLYTAVYGRKPTAIEIATGSRFITAEGTVDPNDPRVWADYIHVMLMAKEFVFVR
ncbi:MAG: PSD1 and planctomycete cytochrome C domain-containing protein [Planctomycetaceae bacterium]